MRRRVPLLGLGLVAAILSGCGGSQTPSYTGAAGVPLGPPPVGEAAYVADPGSGTILEVEVGGQGQLAPIQTTTGFNGVTDVVLAADGNALFALQSGVITVFSIDHSGESGNLAVQQTVTTSTEIDTPMTATPDATGSFLLVAGTQAGVTTVAAYPLDSSDNLGTPVTVSLTGLTVDPATPNGITSIGINGSQEVAVLALRSTTNNVVGIGFNGTAFNATPGSPATVDNFGATGVTTSGSLLYATGQREVQIYSVDAAGDVTPPGGLSGPISLPAQSGGTNTSLTFGNGLLAVGNDSDVQGLSVLPLQSDGSLGSPVLTNVLAPSNVTVGVNAVTIDPGGLILTANSGGSATSFVLQGLTSLLESGSMSTPGSQPSSIAVVSI